MKKKVMILSLAGVLALSGISIAYAAGSNNTFSNKFNRPMMNLQNGEGESLSNYKGTMMSMMGYGAKSEENMNKMIKLMKENGFIDQANAMENKDFNTMKKLMANLSDDDYNKMIDVMKNNGYEAMANMMKSVGKEKMQSMMNK